MEFTEQELESMNEAANDAAFVGGRYGTAERERISEICLTNPSVSNEELETILNGGI